MILHHFKTPKQIAIVYTEAWGLSNSPADPYLFLWQCKPCTSMNANDARIPTIDRYGGCRTLRDLHRKHFPSLCLYTLSTRNPLGLGLHQLVLSLVCAAFFHQPDSLPPVRHSYFCPLLPQNKQQHHIISQLRSCRMNYSEISLGKHSAFGNEPLHVCDRKTC